ncbi:hypothetical protein [Pseudoalteromonas sp. MTN2-4]|uniref:hypothetical protein n=1 Tax=Pseudoalteromonas sp. MTN2-4 TaxID=3056555 RepID=UPI0036F32DC9
MCNSNKSSGSAKSDRSISFRDMCERYKTFKKDNQLNEIHTGLFLGAMFGLTFATKKNWFGSAIMKYPAQRACQQRQLANQKLLFELKMAQNKGDYLIAEDALLKYNRLNWSSFAKDITNPNPMQVPKTILSSEEYMQSFKFWYCLATISDKELNFMMENAGVRDSQKSVEYVISLRTKIYKELAKGLLANQAALAVYNPLNPTVTTLTIPWTLYALSNELFANTQWITDHLYHGESETANNVRESIDIHCRTHYEYSKFFGFACLFGFSTIGLMRYISTSSNKNEETDVHETKVVEIVN